MQLWMKLCLDTLLPPDNNIIIVTAGTCRDMWYVFKGVLRVLNLIVLDSSLRYTPLWNTLPKQQKSRWGSTTALYAFFFSERGRRIWCFLNLAIPLKHYWFTMLMYSLHDNVFIKPDTPKHFTDCLICSPSPSSRPPLIPVFLFLLLSRSSWVFKTIIRPRIDSRGTPNSDIYLLFFADWFQLVLIW